MAKQFEGIDEDLASWLSAQHVFFVATAPLAAEGHVNCSPKGGDSFRVLGPRDVICVRSIVKIQVSRISTSCGYGVPEMAFQQDRK